MIMMSIIDNFLATSMKIFRIHLPVIKPSDYKIKIVFIQVRLGLFGPSQKDLG